MNDTYAILVFMRMLSTFNYESGFISDFDENKTFVSINKICKTIGVSTGQIDSIIKVWESLGIAKEFRYSKSKRYLTISEKVISNIKKGREIRKSLLDSSV